MHSATIRSVAFTTDPLYVTTVLLLLVALAEWLSPRRYFRYLGSALIVIIAAAILANLRLIPSSSDAPPLYDGIFNYIAPLAIFFLLLDVRLRDLRKAGAAMLLIFVLGAAATMAGSLVGYYLIAPQNHGIPNAHAVAGMFTGTYIGGSVNLNTIALQYGVTKEGTLFAALNAADNIVTTIWIVATLLLPRLLQRWFPRELPETVAVAAGAVAEPLEAKADARVFDLALLLALGTGSLFIAHSISHFVPAIPFVLILTTVALALAQAPPVQRLHGARTLGYLTVLVFLAVVGAYCDIGALIANGSIALLLLAWVTIIIAVHGVLLFVISGLMKQDWAIVAVASNANIGGATTAGVLATAIGRDELRLPGILAGSLGTALGTYAGVLVAELLR
ncbi:MAG: DUF819 family protein [Chthoniobacterales bacterium]|nr:DUF819 family protein [Chthoniobacterales bacterium]